MAARFSLDGAMIPRTVKRMFDQRAEERVPVGTATAILELRGRRHSVPIVNTSQSGAMLTFGGVPHIGEAVTIQLRGGKPVQARVRWVRDGRIGVSFDPQPE